MSGGDRCGNAARVNGPESPGRRAYQMWPGAGASALLERAVISIRKIGAGQIFDMGKAPVVQQLRNFGGIEQTKPRLAPRCRLRGCRRHLRADFGNKVFERLAIVEHDFRSGDPAMKSSVVTMASRLRYGTTPSHWK